MFVDLEWLHKISRMARSDHPLRALSAACQKNRALELSHKWTHKRSSELQALQNAPPSQLTAASSIKRRVEFQQACQLASPKRNVWKVRLCCISWISIYIYNYIYIKKKTQPCNSSPLSDGPAAQLAANGSVWVRKSIFQPTSSTP